MLRFNAMGQKPNDDWWVVHSTQYSLPILIEDYISTQNDDDDDDDDDNDDDEEEDDDDD